MSKKIQTEEDAKALLKIDDWRSLSKDKVMDFISLVPNMSKEVALSAIEQFPNYVSMSKDIVDGLITLCDNGMNEITKGTDKCLEAYRLVLESLRKQLDEPISEENKKKINEQMIDIVNQMSSKDSEKNELIKTIINNGQKLLVGIVLVGGAVLGINYYNNK